MIWTGKVGDFCYNGVLPSDNRAKSPTMNDDTPKKKTIAEKLMSPWILGIASMVLIVGAGVASALVAVGILP